MSESIEDNLTVLRFSLAYKTGGGTELYIDDLDKSLLKLYSMTIIRINIVKSDNGKISEKKMEIGKGTLIELTLPTIVKSKKMSKISKYIFIKELFNKVKKIIINYIVYNPVVYKKITCKIIPDLYLKKETIKIERFTEILDNLFAKYKIKLVVFHNIGTSDSLLLLKETEKRKIPTIYVHHYNNSAFNDIPIREQIKYIKTVSGVSSINVPKRITKRYTNLSDGIDTDFYKPLYKLPNDDNKNTLPIVFLPSRITEVKGQKDLIDVQIKLKNAGLKNKLVIAGRIDSVEYMQFLIKYVKDNNLNEDVLFLDSLDKYQMKEWYSRSSVVAFPTYHQEGLGRILLEAQSMEVPVVSYIIGGTSEAISDKKTGFLVKKGDLLSLANKIYLLLTNCTIRRNMGIEGRKFVIEKFSLNAFALRHMQLYTSTLNNKDE